ncbi:DUF4328 domain-containing protein [Streptomyces avicenniae]|uniref:DUF4328 domain-containing protein n=1 Tax=Streptomyces avicenniae TaxID=500153 RepID=UPI00069C8860|nr:DUF4328 domain-containing protein [Streptomyces avicenniae]
MASQPTVGDGFPLTPPVAAGPVPPSAPPPQPPPFSQPQPHPQPQLQPQLQPFAPPPTPGYGYPGSAGPAAGPAYGYPGGHLPLLATPFTSPQGLSTALTALFGVAIAIWLFGMVSGAAMLNLLDDMEGPAAFGLTLDEVQDTLDTWQGTATIQILLMLAIGIVFLIWFYRVRSNAEMFDPAGMRLSRGWAIGAWFVPVVGLWFPKQIANDTWRASAPWGEQARLGLVTAWWLLWLPTVFTSFSALYSDDDGIIDFNDSDEFDEVRSAAAVTVLNGALGIAAAILAILFVRQLTRRQLTKFAQGPTPWATQGAMPPPGAYPQQHPQPGVPHQQYAPPPHFQAPPQAQPFPQPGQQPGPQPGQQPGHQPPGAPPPPF